MSGVLHFCQIKLQYLLDLVPDQSLDAIVFPTNPKTATKWRKRETVVDLKTGPQRR